MPASTPRIDWGKQVPSEVRAAVEPILTQWLRVVPSWCHVLLVDWDEAPEGDDNTQATTESRPAYREAVLTIGALWLRSDAEDRASIIRHELAHLATAQMDDVFERMLAQFKKRDAALHADFKEQWRQALEGATCDIAAAYGAAQAAP
jgi:hypothetical protein